MTRSLPAWTALAAALAGGPAFGAPPDALVLSAGMEAVSEGDRAWWAQDRRTAASAWRRAAVADDPAAVAMAHLRLLQVSGNLGMMVHGPRADRALAACVEGPWCALAQADRHLFAPPQVGARSAEAFLATGRAARALPGPACARRFLILGDPADLADLAALPRDGLGDGLLATGGTPPPTPGTWSLGLGLLGAPGLGYGGAIRLVHPDLAWAGHALHAEAGATTRGNGWAGVAFVSAGRIHGVASARASRADIDVWHADARSEVRLDGLAASAGPGLRAGDWRIRAGGTARWDAVDSGPLVGGHGPWVALAWDRTRGSGAERRGGGVALEVASALPALGAGYPLVTLAPTIRGYAGGPWGSVLAGRLLGRAALGPDAPFHRLPAAGGADVLRGAPDGRWRGPVLAAADLELRRRVSHSIEVAVFGDGAWVRDLGVHPGGGAGVRLVLPPRGLDVVRLDVAASDTGWAVITGFGEAF